MYFFWKNMCINYSFFISYSLYFCAIGICFNKCMLCLQLNTTAANHWKKGGSWAELRQDCSKQTGTQETREWWSVGHMNSWSHCPLLGSGLAALEHKHVTTDATVTQSWEGACAFTCCHHGSETSKKRLSLLVGHIFRKGFEVRLGSADWNSLTTLPRVWSRLRRHCPGVSNSQYASGRQHPVFFF